MLIVPRAVRTACWLNAWLAGQVSTDDTINGLLGTDTDVEFGVGTAGSRLSPALWLGELRRLGIVRVSAAVPAPGDPAGLGGPHEFNADAMQAGAVLLHNARLGMVPIHHEGVTGWSVRHALSPAHLPHPDDADRDLRDAIREAADRLWQLDVASWSPDVADALLNLRAPSHFDAPMAFACTRASGLTITALRCREIVDLALRDDGGAVSATEVTARREALTPLQRSARQALVAASSCTG